MVRHHCGLARTTACAVAFILAAGCADAQQLTTATYFDWVLQCASAPATTVKKTCDIAQVTQVQGKNIPFSRVSVVAPAKGQPAKATVQVPVNVSLHEQVMLQVGDKAPKLSAPFDLCIPGGCFVTFDLSEASTKRLSSPDGTAKISFKDSAGHDIAFPLSLKGFQAAFDALASD